MNAYSNAAPIISVRAVSKTYRTAAGEFPALHQVSFDVHPGDFLGIIGKSGAGKSTLLNMLSGVDNLTAGEVWFGGPNNPEPISIHTLNENERALWRGRNVGIVYQSFQLLPMLNLLENVMLPMDFCGLYHPRRSPERALELLRTVELEEHAFKSPNFISGGQQQRVAIARALANDPPILIADEPTGSLDSVTAETIFELFEKLVSQGKTIVMVTHDNTLGARFTRRLQLSDGQLQLPETHIS